MKRILALAALAVPAIVAACSASSGSDLEESGSTSATTGSGGGLLDVTSVGVGSGGGGSLCKPDEQICDEDLNNPKPCDEGLQLADGDPMNAAKAMDICKVSTNGSWGLVSAKYVRANGAPASAGKNTGLASKFGNGIAPQAGQAMLVLSSGHARDLGMPDACGTEVCMTSGPGVAPPGFPQDVPNCPGSNTINDDIGLEVKLRAPTNAKGYQFNFAFTSFEFAEWVCTDYNDQFVAIVSPPPMGSLSGNICFDSKKNPVSVNIALFDHCNPADKASFASMCDLFGGGSCPNPPSPYCPQGPGFMSGTGFNEWGDAGSTGWLVTTAPVTGGSEFTIRFAIWDAGDQALDSTAIVDNFRWTGDPVGVGTEEVDNPK